MKRSDTMLVIALIAFILMVSGFSAGVFWLIYPVMQRAFTP